MYYWQELSTYVFFYNLDIAKFFIYGRQPRNLEGFAKKIYRDKIETFLKKFILKKSELNIEHGITLVDYKLKINKYYNNLSIIYYQNRFSRFFLMPLLDIHLYGYYKKRERVLFIPKLEEFRYFSESQMKNHIKKQIREKKYIITSPALSISDLSYLESLRNQGFQNINKQCEYIKPPNDCNDDCAICLDKYKNKYCIKFNCGHILHNKCFRKMLFATNSLQPTFKCPYCRCEYELYELL
jgi:hypothetical protein